MDVLTTEQEDGQIIHAITDLLNGAPTDTLMSALLNITQHTATRDLIPNLTGQKITVDGSFLTPITKNEVFGDDCQLLFKQEDGQYHPTPIVDYYDYFGALRLTLIYFSYLTAQGLNIPFHHPLIGEITKEVYNWGIDILLEAVPQRGMTLREKANQ